MKKIIAFLILCALVTSVQCQIDRPDTLLPDLLNYDPEIDMPSEYPVMTKLERAHFEMGHKAIEDAITSIMLKEAPDTAYWETRHSLDRTFYTLNPVKYLGREAMVESVPILVVKNQEGDFFLCIYFNDIGNNPLWLSVERGIMYTLYLDDIDPLSTCAHQCVRYNDAIIGVLYAGLSYADDMPNCSWTLDQLDKLFLYYELE